MAGLAQYPVPGCVVEYLEDNATRIALVLEEAGGKLRLLSPGRRESKLPANRLLPWLGPVYPENISKDDAARVLENHKRQREQKAAGINALEVWELSQGEIAQAPAVWFAELFENEPDADSVAAFGRALLNCKSHFRFQPPEFLIYDAETVEKRLAEQKAREQREALAAGGAEFLHILWEIASKRRPIPDNLNALAPSAEAAEKIEILLRQRMLDPFTQEEDRLWQTISKGLPDVPHLALQLLEAWGKVPGHYNFWLDRAGYERGDDWWRDCAGEVERLKNIGECVDGAPEFLDLPFISIDGPDTTDIDDAFSISQTADGLRLVIALACPALGWQFGSALNQKTSHRATSIYLPEGNLHMLPRVLGEGAFSLWAGKRRPSLCIGFDIKNDGSVAAVQPFLASVRLAANLRYHEAQVVLDAMASGTPLPENAAAAHAGQLALANAWAKQREALRVDRGAVVMIKPEQKIDLVEEGGETIVKMEPEAPKLDANRIVAEMMVLASSAIADWAFERGIPLIHRTQDIALGKECAGIWQDPADLAVIIRSLMPSMLEVRPRPHAALAATRYAPVTSPLRRYADLANEGQILAWLQTGKPLWGATELESLLATFSPSLAGATQAQKFRPRYWKLLYFRQQGDQLWWNGVITEENDTFATASLPDQGIICRGRRDVFDERATPGANVRVRIGKVNPLYNEIHVLEAETAE